MNILNIIWNISSPVWIILNNNLVKYKPRGKNSERNGSTAVSGCALKESTTFWWQRWFFTFYISAKNLFVVSFSLEQIASKITEILYISYSLDALSTEITSKVITHHCLLSLPNRFWTVQTTAFNRYTSTSSVEQFNYPTTHPVFIAPLRLNKITQILSIWYQTYAVIHFGGGCLFHMLSALEFYSTYYLNIGHSTPIGSPQSAN